MSNVTTPREPIIAAVISWFIPGAGQMYNGQMKKGIIILVGDILFWVLVFGLYFVGGFLAAILTAGVGSILLFCCMPMLFLPLLVNLWAAYDGYKTAKRINAGEAIKDWLS